MADEIRFIERRKKSSGRSLAENVIAIAAVIGLLVSLFTGIRAFYVNEYRIDILEVALKEARGDVSHMRGDIQELDRSVQRLVGAATNNGWIGQKDKH